MTAGRMVSKNTIGTIKNFEERRKKHRAMGEKIFNGND